MLGGEHKDSRALHPRGVVSWTEELISAVKHVVLSAVRAYSNLVSYLTVFSAAMPGRTRRRWHTVTHLRGVPAAHHDHATTSEFTRVSLVERILWLRAASSFVHCTTLHCTARHGTTQVRALGALLVHLQSTVFALEESGSVDVNAVRQLDVSGSMRIDGIALRSVAQAPRYIGSHARGIGSAPDE